MTTYTATQVVSAAAQGIDLGAATIVDWGQNIAADLDALQPLAAAGRIAAIQIPDWLELSAAQVLADKAVIGLVQPGWGYQLHVSGATVAQALQLGEQPYTTIDVVDTPAAVQAGLDGLQAMAGGVGSIDLSSDGSFQTLTLTPTQLANDAAIISRISSTDGQPLGLPIITEVGQLTIAQAIAAVQVNGGITGLTIVDSAAHVQQALNGLAGPLYDNFASITLTDTSTPTFTVARADSSADFSVLNAISTPYFIDFQGVSVYEAVDWSIHRESLVIPNLPGVELSVTDRGANVEAGIDALEIMAKAGQLVSITLTDTSEQTLSFTPTQELADADAIAKIASPYILGTVVDSSTYTAALAIAASANDVPLGPVAILDSAENIEAYRSSLEILAATGKIASIELTGPDLTFYLDGTDTALMGVLEGNYSIQTNASVAEALQIGQRPQVKICLTDTGAAIQASLDGLEAMAGSLSSIGIDAPASGTTTLTFSATQVKNDLTVIRLITPGNVNTMMTVDGSLSIADAVAAEHANGYIADLTVVDSAADVQAVLNGILPRPPGFNAWGGGNSGSLYFPPARYSFASITVTDPGIPTFTVPYLASGNSDASDVLAAITTPNNIEWLNVPVAAAASYAEGPRFDFPLPSPSTVKMELSVADSGAAVQAGIDGLETLALAGKLASISLTDASKPVLTFTAAQQVIDADAIARIQSAYVAGAPVASTTYPASQVISAAEKGVSLGAANIQDSSAAIQADLDALQPLAVAGKIGSIQFTDATAPILSLNHSQMAADAAVVGLFQGSFTVYSDATVAQALVWGRLSHIGLFVDDTAAAIQAGLDGLQAEVASLVRIEVDTSSGGTTPLTLSPSQLASDAQAISLIQSQLTCAGPLTMGQAVSAELLTGNMTGLIVIDTAANVQAALNTLAVRPSATGDSNPANYNFASITITDAGTPTFDVPYSEAALAAGPLDAVASPHIVEWTAAPVAKASSLAAAPNTIVSIKDTSANIEAGIDSLETLALAGKLGVVIISDAHVPQFTEAQLLIDSGAIDAIRWTASQAVSGLSLGLDLGRETVEDTAADVDANLDSLQTLATAGKLASIILTDGYTPTLSVTAAQAAQDAAAIYLIVGNYSLSVTDMSVSVATFVNQQNPSGRGTNGIAADYAGMAPAGGNSVVGFQDAKFTSGIDTVVLDGPRSSYAIQVAADGSATIKDVGVGDANYGDSVKVSGETYIVFNGANLAASTVLASGAPTYPNDMYFIENPANAQLAEFYAAVLQRTPDLAGLEYWESGLAQGGSIVNVAQDFLTIIHATYSTSSPITTLGGDPFTMNNTQFVSALYQNILGRQADPGGLAYWVEQMNNGASEAQILVAFTSATATISAVNAEAGSGVGTGSGWLIAPSVSGGYADPGMQMTASSALAQAVQSNNYNLSLIDPTTVPAGGLTASGATLTPGALQIAANAPAAAIVLSSSFTTLTAANSGDVIHDGPGADTITVTGSGDFITVGTATTDVLHLAGGTNSFVFNFVPGHGSLIDASGTGGSAVTLLNGTTTAVQGSNLTFGAGASPIYVNIGNTGGGTALEVVTAANKAYVPADIAGEHVLFLGTDSGGDTQLWSYKTDGAHQVDTGALTLIATLIGVPAGNLTAVDLA